MSARRTLSLGTVLGSLLVAAAVGTTALGAPDRMDRKQAEAVSRAESYTSGIAEELAGVKKVQAELEAAKDASMVPQSALKDLKEQLKMMRNRLSQAERGMKHIVDDHADVKAANALIAEQKAAIEAVAATVEAFEKKQNEVRDVGNYPNFKADCEKLKTWTKVYAPFDLLRDPQRVADTAARWQEDVQTAKGLFEQYRPIMQQGTHEGKNFHAYYTNLAKNIIAFQKSSQEFVNEAPKTVEASLAKALSVAEKAAAEKKPAFFDGGVRQELENAKKHVEVYSALVGEKHESTVELATAVAEHEKKIAVLKESLKEEILAATKTPADVYKHADKGTLREMVVAEWKKKFPADEIMAVRFVEPEWKRKTGHSWNAGYKSWDFFDYSDLTARIIIKKDNRLATLCYVTLRKDHQANDLTKASAHKGDLYIVEDMLLANLEQ